MSRNPYHRNDGSLELRRSVFAFFDILGYTDYLRKAASNNDTTKAFANLYNALSTGRDRLEDKYPGSEFEQTFKSDFFALKAFTDNIVIGWPVHDDAELELGDALGKLMDFQFSMTIEGFFIRGAISVGDAFVDDIAVFGGALIEAYDVESKIARDPRIVLAPSAVETTKLHLRYYPDKRNAPHAREILRDADGQWFLNYLEAVLIAEEEHGPFFEKLLLHKKIVEERLAEFRPNPPIWSKYAWAASYHNYFCDSYPHWFTDEHKIQLELFRAAPTSIIE